MHEFLMFLQEQWTLVLAAVVVIALMLKGPLMRRMAGYGEVDPATAVGLINHENAVVIDVREHQEWAEGHVPGARHIPLGDLSKYLRELEKHKGHHVICLCRSGMRSARAAALLKKAGYDNVYNLKGGIGAWRGAGLPVEK